MLLVFKIHFANIFCMLFTLSQSVGGLVVQWLEH